MVKEQIDEQASSQATTNLIPAQEFLQELWEEHLRDEFVTHNTEDTLATMVEDAYVNNIPVMTGGVGQPALHEFYSKYFIPQMPPDTELTPLSRTIGTDRLVDEMVFKFTHTIQMDWMLPGIAPTGKRVPKSQTKLDRLVLKIRDTQRYPQLKPVQFCPVLV